MIQNLPGGRIIPPLSDLVDQLIEDLDARRASTAEQQTKARALGK